MHIKIKFIYLLFLVNMWGCQFSEEEEKLRIGFSQCKMDDNWRQMMYSEVQREMLFHENYELIYRNAEGRTDLQLQQIKELVSSDIDILIISPNESQAFKEIIEEIYKTNLPIVLIDRKVNSDAYTSFIGGNNRLIGQEAAKYIASKLKRKGKVLELHENLSSSAFYERSAGFHETMKQFPGIQIDSILAMDIGVDRFIKTIKNNKYDAIFAHTDVAAEFAYRHAMELGTSGNAFYVGIDGLAIEGGGLELVQKGILKASLLYPTGGDVAIQLAIDILENRPFVKENELPTTLIDSANVSLMIIQANKLLDQQDDIKRLGGKLDELNSVFQNQKTLIYLITLAMIFSIVLTAFVFQSLIEKKRINNELEEKNRQIIEISARAEEATQAKFRFFTNISHEFRTPLTLMLGPIEELIAAESSNSKKKDLNFVRKNAIRLLRLINQLMDFRKIENNKMNINVSEQNIVDFIKEIKSTFDNTAEHRKIDFRLITENPKINVWFDEDMLDKVFFNILSNAFKFTSDLGQIHIKVQMDGLNNLVRILFEDNGKGMTEDQIDHAFERFYQGEKHSTIEGTGLGLSLSKELISLHSGNIELKSQYGKGTRFEISLPLGSDHLDEKVVKSKKTVRNEKREKDFVEDDFEITPDEQFFSKEHSILIIEDNADLREFLNTKLASQYQIMVAEDGETGILKAVQYIPDLIICDLMLPRKNGHEVLRNLKSNLKTSHIPIILLTAKTNIEEQVVGIQEGADDYIVKPFNFRFLAERIRMILLNRQKLRDHYLHQVPSDVQTPSGSLDKKFTNDFIAIVEGNFTDPAFGVIELCDKLSMSRVQLYRKVKALMGYSVNDYINMVRLKKASFLLKDSNLSISEIAYQVGYSSPAYFSTAFKAQFGSSPKDYKTS